MQSVAYFPLVELDSNSGGNQASSVPVKQRKILISHATKLWGEWNQGIQEAHREQHHPRYLEQWIEPNWRS
jgi:hypothetical protein